MVRLLLVDDHLAFRESFRIALQQQPSFSVAGEAGTAREVYAQVEELKPDLIVADLMLKDTDGVSVARELSRRGLDSRILILTMHTNGLFVRDAFDAGV